MGEWVLWCGCGCGDVSVLLMMVNGCFCEWVLE